MCDLTTNRFTQTRDRVVLTCPQIRAFGNTNLSRRRSWGKVGNASGVFQAGVACVFSIARLLERLREFLGSPVVEPAVKPNFVVRTRGITKATTPKIGNLKRIS
jgi:hypothetical protein